MTAPGFNIIFLKISINVRTSTRETIRPFLYKRVIFLQSVVAFNLTLVFGSPTQQKENCLLDQTNEGHKVNSCHRAEYCQLELFIIKPALFSDKANNERDIFFPHHF